MRASREGIEEIRRAIEAARQDAGPRGQSVAGSAESRDVDVPGSHERPGGAGRTLMQSPRSVLSRAELSVVVPIVGCVPVAFFRWFREIKEQASLEWRLLDLCSFEVVDDQPGGLG